MSFSAAVKLYLRLLVASLLVGGCMSLAAAQHEFGEFQILVHADQAQNVPEQDYQIVVEDEELLLTRLTANYDGRLSNSFVADLNKDGAFEVIVTFSFDDGHQTGVHVYSWQDFRLQPHRVAALDVSQQTGYRGNDEFAVSNGQLVRIFQLYKQTEGEWQPTSEQRRLRYSFNDARWVKE